jgi:membrane protease YdiL (CAAX protease family)
LAGSANADAAKAAVTTTTIQRMALAFSNGGPARNPMEARARRPRACQYVIATTARRSQNGAAVLYSRKMSMSSPPPPLSRASLVIGLYAAMAIAAFVVAAGRGDPDLYRLGGAPTPAQLALSPLLGAAIGAAVVAMTRLEMRHFRWARDLHASFRDLLGPLAPREVMILALASSIGEELLFRGALLPWLGVWVQAIIFAGLHVGPGKRFLPWTLHAFVLGLAFGALAEETGNLGGPIAAHFAINFLNLRHIVRVPASA